MHTLAARDSGHDRIQTCPSIASFNRFNISMAPVTGPPMKTGGGAASSLPCARPRRGRAGFERRLGRRHLFTACLPRAVEKCVTICTGLSPLASRRRRLGFRAGFERRLRRPPAGRHM